MQDKVARGVDRCEAEHWHKAFRGAAPALDQRAAVQVRGRHAKAHCRNNLGEAGDEAVVPTTLHQQSAAAGAGLAGVLHDRAHDDGNRTRCVNVVEHDLR